MTDRSLPIRTPGSLSIPPGVALDPNRNRKGARAGVSLYPPI